MKKLVAFIFGLFHVVLCFSQDDSLMLGGVVSEVVITEFVRCRASLAKKTYWLNEQKALGANDLGAWLDTKGLAQVNRSGPPGAVSSIRFRGMASDHSSILWNGVPINSLSLGMCDLSLIPTFLFDQLALNNEPTATEGAYSNLGACIDLSNVALDTVNSTKFFLALNSLNNATYGIDVKKAHLSKSIYDGSERFADGHMAWRTKAYYQQLENTFSYKNNYVIDKPTVQQVHNNGAMAGIAQDVSWHWELNEWNAKLWHQQRQVLLPASGAVPSSDAQQEDDFTRFSTALKLHKRNSDLNISYAFNDELLHYQSDLLPDGEYLIDSKTKAQSHIVTAKGLWNWNEHFYLQTDVLASSNTVQNSNYKSDLATMLIGQGGLSVIHHQKNQRIELSARHELRSIATQPSFSLFYSRKLIEQKEKITLTIEAMAARRFRAPDMNELFWQPGGNPHLKPEQGWNANGAFYFEYRKNKWQLDARISYYMNAIKQWIQWQPSEAGYWQPVNYKQVISQGNELETNVSQRLRKTKWTLSNRFNHNYAIGSNSDTWNKDETFWMTYTPRFTNFTSFSIERGLLGAFATHKYTALRYTNETNTLSNALPAYFYVICGLQAKMKFQAHILSIAFSVDNALDTAYESVLGYAMPGRVYQVSLQFEFKYKNKKSNTTHSL